MLKPTVVRNDDLLSQRDVIAILGKARTLRLKRAGWLVPQKADSGRAVLYSAKNVRAVIRRFEHGETTAPDHVEVARVRTSEIRHGRAYVPRPDPHPVVDFNSLDLAGLI